MLCSVPAFLPWPCFICAVWNSCSGNVTNVGNQTSIAQLTDDRPPTVISSTTTPTTSIITTSEIIAGTTADTSMASTHTIDVTTADKPSSPVITRFSLEEWNYAVQKTLIWEKNLIDMNPPDIRLRITENTLNITCTANAHPKPEVTIMRDQTQLETIGDATSLIRPAHLNYSGVYACQATNLHGSTKVQKMIQFSVEETDPHDNVHPSQGKSGSQFTWSAFAALIPIAIVIVAVIGYRNRDKLFISSRSVKSKNSSDDAGAQAVYATITDMKTCSSVPGGQVVHDHENTGRTISEDGLIYVTIAPIEQKCNKKPKKTKQIHEDRVEYVSLNYDASGHALITEEAEEMREDQMTQMETDTRTDKVDNNKE